MNPNLSILDNEYIAVLIVLFLYIYGVVLSRVGLPDYIRNLFNNNIFRVVFLSLLLLHDFNKSPHVALIIALAFIITMNYLNQLEIKENFAYLAAYKTRIKNKNKK